MSFNLSTKCVIAGLLLYLVAVHVIAEAKTYNKIICKTSDLGNDDLVTVVKGEELIAECFYHEGKCSNTPNTVGRLTEQSGYLVLIIQNINPLDHYDAYRWDRSGKTLLKSFSLDEVAVGDSERVEVKSGENVTLRVKTPGNVSLVTLTLRKKCENRTEELIIRYCSPEEEKMGCPVKKSDRFSIRSDTESLSVIFSDARVSDEGSYIVSYIDNFDILKEKFFEVTVSGSLETPRTNSLEYWMIIALCIALLTAVTILVILVIIVINRKKKKLKTTGDPEEIISLSSAGAVLKKTRTDDFIKSHHQTEAVLL